MSYSDIPWEVYQDMYKYLDTRALARLHIAYGDRPGARAQRQKYIEYLFEENPEYQILLRDRTLDELTPMQKGRMLLTAIANKRNDLAEFLIRDGVDMNDRYPYYSAPESTRVRLALARPLPVAIENQNYEIFRFLLDHNIEILPEDVTIASVIPPNKFLKDLDEAGAPLDEDSWRGKPIVGAILSNLRGAPRLTNLRYLLERGVRPDPILLRSIVVPQKVQDLLDEFIPSVGPSSSRSKSKSRSRSPRSKSKSRSRSPK